MDSSKTILEKNATCYKQLDFQHLTRIKQALTTPPMKRLIFNKKNESPFQPVVICTYNDQKDIYGLRPNIKVDLTGYTNRQNVKVDERFMRRLTSSNGKEKLNVVISRLDMQTMVKGSGNKSETQRKAEQDYSLKDLTRHFAQVTCRPSKTMKMMSRVNGQYKSEKKEEMASTPKGTNTQSSEIYENYCVKPKRLFLEDVVSIVNN